MIPLYCIALHCNTWFQVFIQSDGNLNCSLQIYLKLLVLTFDQKEPTLVTFGMSERITTLKKNFNFFV